MAETLHFFQGPFAPRIVIWIARLISSMLALSMIGCAPYRYDTRCYENCLNEPCDAVTENNIELARDHWLYNVIPRHRSQICWYDLGHWTSWSLLGNDDDGIFGEEPTADFRRECPPSVKKALAWGWRNPCHNLCFYVLGSADRTNDEFTLLKLTPCCQEAFVYRPVATTVFAGTGPSLFIALHGLKPFISARVIWSRKWEGRFYIGWRCRGNFGFRCNPIAHRKLPKPMDMDDMDFMDDMDDMDDMRQLQK